jgi:hypothetical protein
MKITVVKKGSSNFKPVASCPWAVDEFGPVGSKKD